jgi:hypothetical protein
MISDSCDNKICKRCGGPVVYWDPDFVEQFAPVKVKHDFMWSSNKTTPDMIDPNYEPRDMHGERVR